MTDPISNIKALLDKQKLAIEAQRIEAERIRVEREKEAIVQKALRDQSQSQSPNK